MGEKIKDLERLKDGFVIELNKSQQIGGERQIHLQNSKMRLQFSESEFLQFALLLLNAKYHLLSYKKKKNGK